MTGRKRCTTCARKGLTSPLPFGGGALPPDTVGAPLAAASPSLFSPSRAVATHALLAHASPAPAAAAPPSAAAAAARARAASAPAAVGGAPPHALPAAAGPLLLAVAALRRVACRPRSEKQENEAWTSNPISRDSGGRPSVASAARIGHAWRHPHAICGCTCQDSKRSSGVDMHMYERA